MNNKKYEYQGKIYCDKDLSYEIDNYGGDIYDLYLEMRKDGDACEATFYYSAHVPDYSYNSYEDLIENEYSDLEVKNEE